MKERIHVVLILLVLLSKGTNSNDFDAFCELVSLSPNKASWCSNCSNPCANKNCGVDCNSDKTAIISISAGSKSLTAIPESIGNLTSLTYL